MGKGEGKGEGKTYDQRCKSRGGLKRKAEIITKLTEAGDYEALIAFVETAKRNKDEHEARFGTGKWRQQAPE